MSVAEITKMFLILSIAFAVLMIVCMIVKSKKPKNAAERKKGRTAVTCILLAVIIAANGAIYAFNNIINQHFSSVKVDDMAVRRQHPEILRQRLRRKALSFWKIKKKHFHSTQKRMPKSTSLDSHPLL